MSKFYFWFPIIALALVLFWRLAASRYEVTETPEAKVADAPPVEPCAVIRRVLGTEKLNRDELKINLALDVQPLDAPAYQADITWVIRPSRIAAIHLGQSVPVILDATQPAAVRPAVDWAKPWQEAR